MTELQRIPLRYDYQPRVREIGDEGPTNLP
jgi:hypothetical protein